MSATLRNVTTGDNYTDAATVQQPYSERVLVQVSNAAVFYELDLSEHGYGSWSDERFLLPTQGSLARKCSGIRFRSANVGAPAQVSAELLNAEDLAEGADSLAPQGYEVTAGGAVSPVGTSDVTPTGVIVPYAGSVAPSGWVLCDGSTYDGTQPTYMDLWAVIGVTYGGSGQSAFTVPDLRGRVAVGKGTHADVNALGKSDGAAAGNRRPKHGHDFPTGDYPVNEPGSGAAGGSAGGFSIDKTAGHQRVGPTGMDDTPAYLVLNYLIKL